MIVICPKVKVNRVFENTIFQIENGKYLKKRLE